MSRPWPCQFWPEPCHGDLSYFISSSILISLSLNLNLHSLSIFLIGNIVCMCIYSVLCSVIGGYSQQAKILSYGGWVLGPRYKINHMLCLGHPIHFITFIPCPIYKEVWHTLDELSGQVDWTHTEYPVSVGDLVRLGMPQPSQHSPTSDVSCYRLWLRQPTQIILIAGLPHTYIKYFSTFYCC